MTGCRRAHRGIGMTQKFAHTHSERACDRRDRGQCGIDLSRLDPRHVLLSEARENGERGLRQSRAPARLSLTFRRTVFVDSDGAAPGRVGLPRSEGGAITQEGRRRRGQPPSPASTPGIDPDPWCPLQSERAKPEQMPRARRPRAGSDPRGAGRPRNFVAEQDFDAVREFVMRMRTPPVSE